MQITLSPQSSSADVQAIQLVSYGSTLGLYSASTVQDPNALDDDYSSVTTLTGTAVGSGAAPSPTSLSFAPQLPVPPDWALLLTADGTGELAATNFGGGWNALTDAILAGGTPTPRYSYDVEDTVRPHFMLNSGSQAAQTNYVSAIFSGYQLGLIGLQTQDGQQVAHVSGIVGSSDAPVGTGRVIGDLSAGLPTSQTVAWQANKLVGPMAPSGGFCGSLMLASYDLNSNKLGTPVPLLPDLEISDFDLAVMGGTTLCVLAVTGTGAPLVGLFDLTGKTVEAPALPLGSWSNPGRYVTSPSVVPSPDGKGFAIAFIEQADGAPVAIQAGTVVPAVTP